MKSWARTLVLVFLAGYVVAAQQAAQKTAAPAATRSTTARPLPTAAAESVGISSERLDRLHAGMQAYVDRHEVGGIVTLIARDGKVVDVHTNGFQDAENHKPMQVDTIFRIASMTKPITSVAVMMLEEEGQLSLTDPVSKYIPAFKGQRVAADGGTTVPARREITIRDLLSHRSGLSYGFLNGGPVGDAYRKEGVTDGLTVTSMTLQEGIDKLAAQPLMAQPGSAWNYSLSVDVLGRVVEVVSGKSFDAFLRDRIINPLGMTDTAFVVPDSKWSRFSTVYSPNGSGNIRPMKDPEEAFGNAHLSQFAVYKEPKKYFSGGAGLTSTIQDYARFAQMLLNGGSLDGVRLLSPTTIGLMTASQTSDLPPNGLLGPGTQFALGFRVVTDVAQTQTQGSIGMYGWLGIYGTTFWVDPKEHLVAIAMVQRYPGSPVAAGFQPLVYSALTKSYVGTP
jgi:CubicO group peptidase (beta-lactamase class C family)